MEKRPFLTEEQAQEIIQDVPTPFHVYDEKGIRENARKVMKAFSWNKGFQEYFAVKATPNPTILKILREEGCGTDCSSLTELMMSDRCGFTGSEIMFSSNETPACEFELAAKLGATINLDDFTHIDFLKDKGYLEKDPDHGALRLTQASGDILFLQGGLSGHGQPRGRQVRLYHRAAL